MQQSVGCAFRARRWTSATLASLGLLGVAGLAHGDDLMRCGSVLITIGMVAPQVVAKCGPPKDKSVTEAPKRVRRANGTTATFGTSRVERWTYDRGYGQFPAVLTFEEGKLKSIELQTR
jgi:hypothetical protein